MSVKGQSYDVSAPDSATGVEAVPPDSTLTVVLIQNKGTKVARIKFDSPDFVGTEGHEIERGGSWSTDKVPLNGIYVRGVGGATTIAVQIGRF